MRFVRTLKGAATGLLLTACCSLAWAGFGIGDLKKIKQGAEDVKSILPMSTKEEVELGESVAAEVREQFGVFQNYELTRYVSLVGKSVALLCGRNDVEYTFTILNTEDANAYAAPGGFVFITKGLLRMCETESALAGVLGHEIVHISQKHAARAIQKGNILSIAAREALKDKNSEAYKKLANFSKGLVLNGFGRNAELESDRLGAGFAYGVGYNPWGLVNLLGRLDKSSSGGLSFFFKKHPPTKDRISELKRLIAKENMESAGKQILQERFAQNTGALKGEKP